MVAAACLLLLLLITDVYFCGVTQTMVIAAGVWDLQVDRIVNRIMHHYCDLKDNSIHARDLNNSRKYSMMTTLYM